MTEELVYYEPEPTLFDLSLLAFRIVVFSVVLALAVAGIVDFARDVQWSIDELVAGARRKL